MSNRRFQWLLLTGQLLLVPALLLFLVEAVALCGPLHRTLYRRQNAAQATGLTEAGVERAGDALIDYLRGARADLALTDTVYGVEQTVFGSDEAAHMRDVKALFDRGRALRTALALGGAGLTLVGFLLTRDIRRTFRALKIAAATWAMLLALLAGYAALDFTRAFIAMHHLLFTNDLWLMTPDQLMIRMLPEPFFLTLAALIALAVLIGLALLFTLGAALGKRKEAAA